MADAPGPRSRGASAPDSGDNSTRLDIKRSVVQPGARPLPGSDSYEIPVHITSADLGQAPAAGSADFVDEMPTAIFRPDLHPSPAAARSAPEPQPNHAAPPKMAPVDFTDLTGDEWDGETVVKKPAALTTTKHRDRPPSGRERAQKPFNADETVNLQGDIGIDVDFSDDTGASPPPRRPR